MSSSLEALGDSALMALPVVLALTGLMKSRYFSALMSLMVTLGLLLFLISSILLAMADLLALRYLLALMSLMVVLRLLALLVVLKSPPLHEEERVETILDVVLLLIFVWRDES
ncbi:hypothetical protein F5Y15DRAFT_391642, partial [Xylariaceae sp. FL0016]